MNQKITNSFKETLKITKEIFLPEIITNELVVEKNKDVTTYDAIAIKHYKTQKITLFIVIFEKSVSLVPKNSFYNLKISESSFESFPQNLQTYAEHYRKRN